MFGQLCKAERAEAALHQGLFRCLANLFSDMVFHCSCMSVDVLYLVRNGSACHSGLSIDMPLLQDALLAHFDSASSVRLCCL